MASTSDDTSPSAAARGPKPAVGRTRRHSISRGETPQELPVTFSKEDLVPQGYDRFVIHPDNALKTAWDIFILLSVVFTATVEPLKVAYGVSVLENVDLALDVCFAFDIFLQFFCGYHDSGGNRFPVLIFRLVARRYMETWLAIDILAAIPFDRFFDVDAASAGADSVFIRLPGLIKTVRLLKLKRIMRKWNALTFGPALKVITVLVLWLLTAHWVSCGFFLIGWYSCNSYRETWVTKYWVQMKPACQAGLRPDPSVVTEDTDYFVTPVTFLSVHNRCMYWAMATMSSMGYGRAPTAFTDAEYAYAIFTQILGACLAAAIFSNIGQMLNKGDQVTIRYQAQLDKVREFSALYRLPAPLRTKLAQYSELLFAVNRGYDPTAIASMFPAAVQEEIWLDMHRENVVRVPMFRAKGCDEFFISTVVRALRVNVLLDGDFAFRKGEVGDKMYFVKMGFIQIGTADRSLVFVSKGPGTYVGELTLFSPGQRRSASAWSLCDCVLFTFSVQDFKQVLDMFDRDGTLYEQMKHITQSEAERQKQVNAAQKDRRASAQLLSNGAMPLAAGGAPLPAPLPATADVESGPSTPSYSANGAPATAASSMQLAAQIAAAQHQSVHGARSGSPLSRIKEYASTGADRILRATGVGSAEVKFVPRALSSRGTTKKDEPTLAA